MKITYFDTLYKREAYMMVCGEITFEDGAVHFASGGHRYCIRLEHIRKIEED